MHTCPWACGQHIYIRQSTRAHGITIAYIYIYIVRLKSAWARAYLHKKVKAGVSPFWITIIIVAKETGIVCTPWRAIITLKEPIRGETCKQLFILIWVALTKLLIFFCMSYMHTLAMSLKLPVEINSWDRVPDFFTVLLKKLTSRSKREGLPSCYGLDYFCYSQTSGMD